LRQHPASLPTPLWHELLDLCGGEYAQISAAVRAENGGGDQRGAS